MQKATESLPPIETPVGFIDCSLQCTQMYQLRKDVFANNLIYIYIYKKKQQDHKSSVSVDNFYANEMRMKWLPSSVDEKASFSIVDFYSLSHVCRLVFVQCQVYRTRPVLYQGSTSFSSCQLQKVQEAERLPFFFLVQRELTAATFSYVCSHNV